MPAFFGLSFQELLAAKHPTAWVDFECGCITEEEMVSKFFLDGRPVDGDRLKSVMREKYHYIDGMESLLSRLSSAGYEMHTLSNYPSWYKIIEDKLKLSKYVKWTYISCEGPMQGHRKPNAQAYASVLSHLGIPPERALFVDDRGVNIEGAIQSGIQSILFKNADALERDLRARGLEF